MTGQIDSEASVENVMSGAAKGLNINALQLALPALSRRTLQRKLAALTNAGLLTVSGAGRSARYQWAGATPQSGVPTESNDTTRFPSFIAVSNDSFDILAYVDRPLAARTPIGYQQELLSGYQPGRTWYLPESMRKQLHATGETGAEPRPAGTHGRRILNRLLIDLSRASSQLEGNTYTRLDTRKLIENGQAATGREASETQMILNHKAAIELRIENTDALAFNRLTLMNLHSALAENLVPNPADERRLRSHIVETSGSVYRPLSVPTQISDAFDLMLDKVTQIADPFEQSLFMTVHLPYLQAFSDINKRTSRLAANLPLIRANLCPLTFLDVPEPLTAVRF